MDDRGRDNSARPAGDGSGRFAAATLSRRAGWIVAGGIVAVYLLGVTGRWWPTNDGALYAGLARSLAAGRGMWFNGSLQTSVTPGLPMVLAGLIAVFGEGIWVANLLMALCGLALAGVVYLTIRELDDPPAATWTALLTALSYLLYFNSHRVLTDVPAALLWWVSIYAALRWLAGRWVWAVPAIVAAVCTLAVRVPALPLVLLGGVGLLWHASKHVPRRRRIAGGLSMLGVALAAGGAYVLIAWSATGSLPRYADLLARYMELGVRRRLGDYAHGLATMPNVFAELFTDQDGDAMIPIGAALIVLTVLGAVRLFRRGLTLPTVVTVCYPFVLIFFAGARSLRTRYLLPVFPLVVYAALEGLTVCLHWFARARRPPIRPRALATAGWVFVIVFAAFNVPKIARNAFYYSYLARTDRYLDVIADGRYAELREIAEIARSRTAADDVGLLSGEKENVLHFFSGRTIRTLPEVVPINVREADRLTGHIAERDRAAFVVVNIDDAEGGFAERLDRRLVEGLGLRRVHDGEDYRAYLRPGRGQ